MDSSADITVEVNQGIFCACAVDSDPQAISKPHESDSCNDVTNCSSVYNKEPLPNSSLVNIESISTSNGSLRCFVCYKKLSVPTKGINESNRNSSSAKRFAVSLEKDLYGLSKMFDISPTIYQNEINFMGSVNVNIPFQVFCKSCKATIFSALDLLSEIESLKNKLGTLRTEVMNSLIDTYNYEACENENKSRNSFYGNNGPHSFLCSEADTSINGVLTRLRKAYVQCWTPCQVNANLKNKEVRLSEADAVCAKGTKIREVQRFRERDDDVDVKINKTLENAAGAKSSTCVDFSDIPLPVSPTVSEGQMSASNDEHDSDSDFDVDNEFLVNEPESSSVKNKRKNYTRNNRTKRKMKKLRETNTSEQTVGEYDKGVLRISPYRQRQLNEVLETGSRAAYVCNICGKGYRLKHYFEVHQKCHSGNATFPCSSCPESEPKIFTSLSKLRQHRLIRHRSIFTSSDSDNKNIKHRQKESEDALCFYDSTGQLQSFECKHCHEKFLKKEYLDSDGQFSMKCPTSGCEEPFAKFVKFSLHHQKSCCAAKRMYLKPVEIYQCEHCGIKVSSSSYLSTHIITAHTKEFNFYCEVCGAGFVFKSFLKQHMYCHTDVKEFKCPVCSSLFKRKKQMAIHMKNHTNEASYMCQNCGKRFTNKKGLRNHEATHSLEKNFPCPICGKLFVSSKYVRNHVWATHEKARKFRSKPNKSPKCGAEVGDLDEVSSTNSNMHVLTGGLSTVVD